MMVVMKAMGMESDQEVVQMVGRDPLYSSLLLPSIEVLDYMKEIIPFAITSLTVQVNFQSVLTKFIY